MKRENKIKSQLPFILLSLLISLQSVSASSGEGLRDDLRLSVKLGSSFDRLNYFYEKLPDFESGNGLSVDPYFSFSNGVTPSLQFNVKRRRLLIEGLVYLSASYEAFIHEVDGSLRYYYIFSESSPGSLVKTDEAMKLKLESAGIGLLLGWYIRPSFSAGIVLKRNIYQLQVNTSVHPYGLFAQDSTKVIALGTLNILTLFGVSMNYERQIKPLSLESRITIYPLTRFELSPPQPKQTYRGGGIDLLLGVQWKFLSASYQFEYLKSSGSIVKRRNNSIKLGVIITLI